MNSLTEMPDTLTAGTTLKYTRTVPDYPASAGWVLTLYLAGAAVLAKEATASGDSFLVTVTAGETATLGATPGTCRWSERVAKTGEVVEVGNGTVNILPNIATATAGSLRPMPEKLLAAIDAVLEGKITDDVLQYQVAGRGLTLMSRTELYDLRKKILWDVKRIRGKGRAGRTYRVSFTQRED